MARSEEQPSPAGTGRDLSNRDLKRETVSAAPRVPMLDLAAQDVEVGVRIRSLVEEVAASQRFVLGPMVERFEHAAAEYLGARHAIGVSSGSDALVAALIAVGVGAGDEVITTPFSFFATAESILRVGATPRFVDIDRASFNLDPDAVEAALDERVRAILVVHLYGRPAAVERLARLADAHGIALIEDAAQAFGARSGARRAGTFGALGCFSFQPSKPLGGWGDGGLVVSNDAALADTCRSVRAHGATKKHVHARLGGNYRLDAVQAAVLLGKLPALPAWLEARRAHADAYSTALAGVEGLVTPEVGEDAESSSALYTVRVSGGQREALARHLAANGIESAVHYPLPLHRQPALLGLTRFGELPEAERAASEVLSLPLYPELTAELRELVIEAVREFFTRAGHSKRPTVATYQS